MAAIAQCESHQEQFDSSGHVLHGIVNPDDVGYFQINKYYNGAEAKRLGYDINTESGNIGFALYLYGKEGTAPWDASKSCWSKYLTGSEAA